MFAGLSARSGFSEAECAAAAQTGQLARIVKIVELRSRRRALAGPDRLSGAQALARLHELKGRLLDAQLREVGLL